jgi:hypothetical protein
MIFYDQESARQCRGASGMASNGSRRYGRRTSFAEGFEAQAARGICHAISGGLAYQWDCVFWQT